jgi:CRP-like cAMP-binding protein
MSQKSNDILLLEKVLLLRSVNMFKGTNETVLAQIGEIMEEQFYPDEEILFEEGSDGDCMYIIYSGEVRIHKGNHTLATFKKNDFFGELSLLDSDIRSASATCSSDCTLFVIRQEAFYDILETQPQVTRGILQELCKRIRIPDAQLRALSDQ